MEQNNEVEVLTRWRDPIIEENYKKIKSLEERIRLNCEEVERLNNAINKIYTYTEGLLNDNKIGSEYGKEILKMCCEKDGE